MTGKAKQIQITQEMIDAVFSDPKLRRKFANPVKAKSVCEMYCAGATYKEITKKSKCSEFYILDCLRKVLNNYRVFIEGGTDMNMKIIKNPDHTAYQTVTEAVKENGGYCPCMFVKDEDTRCPCRDFREQQTEGECHCGRFVKVKEQT